MRGNDGPVAKDVACNQLRIEAGLQHGLRLGRVFIADQIDQRQRGQRFCSRSVGLVYPRIGLAQQCPQIDRVGRLGPGCHSGGNIQLVQIPQDEDRRQRAQQAQNHAEEH